VSTDVLCEYAQFQRNVLPPPLSTKVYGIISQNTADSDNAPFFLVYVTCCSPATSHKRARVLHAGKCVFFWLRLSFSCGNLQQKWI